MLVRFFNACLWLSGICVLCFVWGFLIEPTQTKIRHHIYEIEGWNSAPLKVVFLADIHIGGEHVPASRVSNLVSLINAQNPDLVLIGGDFIDGHTSRDRTSKKFDKAIETGITHIGQLSAPLGVLAVIGNHDVWYDVDFVSQSLEKQGLIVLQNDGVNLDNQVCIIGLKDEMTQNPDNLAFSVCDNSSMIIALMHSPDSFGLLYSHTKLALTGHTHGGQVNLPLIGRRVTSTRSGKKYAYGRVNHNGIPAYVTSGIGTSILPARFRAPPEIVVIQIQSVKT